MKTKKEAKLVLAFALVLFIAFALNSFIVSGLEAKFQVIAFSCSPSEVVVGSTFSCTATIKNTGDTDGSVTTATLSPEVGNNWIADSAVSSGTSVSAGQTTEVTFTGLSTSVAGVNGFSKIMLDLVEDNYVATKTVNVINVVVTATNSISSGTSGTSFVVTSEVTAGGSIDVTLTFTPTSGGCTTSEASAKTINDLSHGSKQSRTWNVVMGTSGNCVYSVAAAATGDGGVAAKTDTTSATITCSNCSSGGDSSSSSGGGSGGGGGGSSETSLGEISQTTSVEMSNNQKIKFNISNTEHSLTLVNVTDISATITIASEKQTFTLFVGDEKEVDLNADSINDISIKLKSINALTKRANFIISRLAGAELIVSETKTGAGVGEGSGEEGKDIQISEKTKRILIIAVLVLAGIAIISFVLYFILRRKRRKLWGEI